MKSGIMSAVSERIMAALYFGGVACGYTKDRRLVSLGATLQESVFY